MNIKTLNEVDLEDDWTLLEEDNKDIEMIDFGSDSESE